MGLLRMRNGVEEAHGVVIGIILLEESVILISKKSGSILNIFWGILSLA